MKLMVSERWRREICPFCKDGFEQGDTHICGNCSTMMHGECFQENGGCAVLGCNTKTEDWPCCSQCNEQLSQLSAVLCIHCGYHQEDRRYVEGVARQRQEAPREESRIVLKDAEKIDWDLPNQRSLAQKANDGIIYLKIALWLGVALFGVLTVFTNFSRPHHRYFTQSVSWFLTAVILLAFVRMLVPDRE